MEITRKELLLVGFVVALLGVYIAFFTDFGKPTIIPVSFSARPYVRPVTRKTADGDTEKVNWSITFALGRKYPVTSVRVVDSVKYAADPKTPALWWLVGKAVPTDGFVYGADVEGLHPYVSSMRPHELVAGVKYRILVDAGRKAHGEQEFELSGGGRR